MMKIFDRLLKGKTTDLAGAVSSIVTLEKKLEAKEKQLTATREELTEHYQQLALALDDEVPNTANDIRARIEDLEGHCTGLRDIIARAHTEAVALAAPEIDVKRNEMQTLIARHNEELAATHKEILKAAIRLLGLCGKVSGIDRQYLDPEGGAIKLPAFELDEAARAAARAEIVVTYEKGKCPHATMQEIEKLRAWLNDASPEGVAAEFLQKAMAA